MAASALLSFPTLDTVLSDFPVIADVDEVGSMVENEVLGAEEDDGADESEEAWGADGPEDAEETEEAEDSDDG